MKIWIAESVIGVNRVNKKTLKGICEEIGVPYSTAKRRQDKDGGKTVYDSGWVVWREEVK